MSQADSANTTDLAAAERRRKLEALSGPWWVEALARINRTAKPKLVHTPCNRERTGFDGWGR